MRALIRCFSPLTQQFLSSQAAPLRSPSAPKLLSHHHTETKVSGLQTVGLGVSTVGARYRKSSEVRELRSSGARWLRSKEAERQGAKAPWGQGVFGFGVLVFGVGLGAKEFSSEGPRALCSEAPRPPYEVVKRVASGSSAPQPQTPSHTWSMGRSSIDEAVSFAATKDVVLIGEVHDDVNAHKFEAEFLVQAFKTLGKQRKLILSLEMFETDVQAVLDEYLAGHIQERDLVLDGRAWQNYKTDYKPMVEFAKDHNIPIVAANAPRRYVSGVGKQGRQFLQSLPRGSTDFLPPLPYAPASQAYHDKFVEQMRLMHQGMEQSQDQDKGDGKTCPYIGWSAEKTKYMLDAQVLWDATMAHSILLASKGLHPQPLNPQTPIESSGPKALVVHVCGKFHCEQGLGIPEILRQADPSLQVMVAVCAGVDELSTMNESQVCQLGDFVSISAPAESSFEAQHPV